MICVVGVFVCIFVHVFSCVLVGVLVGVFVGIQTTGSGLESTDHLFGHFVKKHSGQLRVQEGLELKGDTEFHFAAVWCVTWGKPPDGLKMAEQVSICAHRLDLVVWDGGNLRDVAFNDWRKTDLQLRPNFAISRLHRPRLFTPRNKLLVLVYISHNLIHLLWSVP